MIRGRFVDPAGRCFPELAASIALPRQSSATLVRFMVDTGADRSCIGARDAAKMGIDYRGLGRQTIKGVGGNARLRHGRVTLMFRDGDTFYAFNDVDVNIFEDSPDQRDIGSLLGRDILNRMDMTYSSSRRELLFEIVNPDVRIGLDRPGRQAGT